VLWITLLFAFLLAALTVWYVALPILQPSRAVLLDEDGPLTELIQRKDTLLLTIKELEFDYQTGKLSAEDFERMDQRLRHQAIALLRRIEQTAPSSIDLEAEIEAEILRRRTTKSAVRNERANALCPSCQAAIRPDDKFCPQCGTRLIGDVPPVAVAQSG
jgi:hypothetical protein